MRQRDRNWLSVHAYTKILGEEIWKTVLFWYAFVGCDAVSQFLGKGKKTAWNTWGRFLETTETFIRLLCVSKLSVSNIKIKENLVVLMYDASCTHTWVNGCWKYLFSKLNHTIDQCPPTRNVQSNIYLEQCRRVIFGQRAHNWKNNPSLWLTGMGCWRAWGCQSIVDNITEASKACKKMQKKLQVKTFVLTWHVYLALPTPYHVLSFADVTVFTRTDITSSMMKYVKLVFCLIVHM